MNEHHFSTVRTARYYMLGEPTFATRWCWLALHGYGQMAHHFLRRFDVVADNQHVVAAPEALARFYLDKEGTHVGAAWMTRAHRLDDIADNMAFLDEVYRRLHLKLPPDTLYIALGFSQGCATLMRWLLHARPPLAGLVLYAGSIPDDLPYAQYQVYLQSFPTLIVYGTQDEFLTPERVAAYREMLGLTGLRLQYYVFEGGHSLTREVLAAIKQPWWY